MAIVNNRIPTEPNRMLITPEDGSAPFYATVTYADEPTDPGTKINKALFDQVQFFATEATGADRFMQDYEPALTLDESAAQVRAVAAADDGTVITFSGTTVYVSEDYGETWRSSTLPTNANVSASTIWGAAAITDEVWAGVEYLGAQDSDPLVIVYSTNEGASWSYYLIQANSGANNPQRCGNFAQGNGVLALVVGESNEPARTFYFSGGSWTEGTSLDDWNYPGYHLMFGNGTFCAVPLDNYSSSIWCWTSADGKTWTRNSTREIDRPVFGVAFGAGKFIALQERADTVWTSTDGQTWTEESTGVNLSSLGESVCWVSYIGEFFYSFNRDSSRRLVSLCRSADGLTWTRIEYDGSLMSAEANSDWFVSDLAQSVNGTETKVFLVPDFANNNNIYFSSSLGKIKYLTQTNENKIVGNMLRMTYGQKAGTGQDLAFNFDFIPKFVVFSWYKKSSASYGVYSAISPSTYAAGGNSSASDSQAFDLEWMGNRVILKVDSNGDPADGDMVYFFALGE